MENFIGWRPKKKYRLKNEVEKDRLRSSHDVLVAGQDIPCLIRSFRSMRLPKEIRKSLKALKIRRPTNMQMQGLPVVLSSRDALLISISREGKTLIFTLPLIISCIQEEKKLQLIQNEGPIGLIIVPSRELASQIFDFMTRLCSAFKTYPKLKIALCTGGIDLQSQVEYLNSGVHIMICTPGRLSDIFSKNIVNLKMCRYLAIDEADRLLDLGFDEEVKSVLSKSIYKLQIVLSASTMPKRMQDFATNFMKHPIYIASERNALKKLRIVQMNDWVLEENKLVKLLEALLRTDPPVLIFCENKVESDKIEGFLKSKKIKSVGLHGGKLQEARSKAIEDFQKKKIDVLIATDMAAKGLSFQEIRHIINFDMPKDIEGYIQRICRTTSQAIISNFISGKADRTFLKDLTLFIIDMGDKIPQFLNEYRESQEQICEICKTFGHQKLFCSIFQQDSLKYELPFNKILINT